MGQVYVVTNKITGLKYVGQTLKTGAKRLQQLANSNTKELVTKAIRKYGIDAFTVEVLDEADDRQTLLAREYYWIHELNTIYPSGYNKTGYLPRSTKERIPRSLAVNESKRSKQHAETRRRRELHNARSEITTLRTMLKAPIKIDNRILLVEGKVYNNLDDPELFNVLRKLGNDWWSSLTSLERIEFKWKLLEELDGDKAYDETSLLDETV